MKATRASFRNERAYLAMLLLLALLLSALLLIFLLSIFRILLLALLFLLLPSPRALRTGAW